MPTAEQNKEIESLYAQKTTLEIIRLMNEWRVKKEELEEKLSRVNLHYDYLRYVLVPQRFDDEGIKNMNVDGIGRVSLTSGIYASVKKDRKEEAYRYLSDTGHGDIITETINAQTLAATIKQMIQKGEEVPEDLFTVTPYTRASITKA